MIVIGGYNPVGVLSDAWEFHLERREWDRISVTGGPSPPERTFFRGTVLYGSRATHSHRVMVRSVQRKPRAAHSYGAFRTTEVALGAKRA